MRGLVVVQVLVMALGACKPAKSRQLDFDLIRVTPDAKLRTDTVGDGKFVDTATFVLVDTENTAREGAYVTLAGTLADASGAVVATLRPQSLWIPAGEVRTFALVDSERKPRPTASAARIAVRGATVPASPPPARIGELHEIEDDGKIVVQGTLISDASRPGQIMVIASFHDADGRPMTRPFSLVKVVARAHQPVQFVGPPGSKHGTIFVGDTVF